ncbi:sec1 family domain containing 1, partial [Mus musculus]
QWMVGSKMAATASIRERQTVALKRMLNFNVPHVKNSTGEPVWKVLIYDRFGQDIISPLLSVKELRDMGITLHLLLHSDRDPIPDVPAVYFVMPTEENIDRLCQDLRNQLYESYYLNFISAISRSKLEDIANAALAASAVTQVAKKLDKKLRENLRDARNSLFTGDPLGTGQFSFQRPLLVLVDRNIDLATPLHHTWTYQALVHDVLDFHLNRVNLEESTGVENSPAGARPKRKNKKSYDLTPVDKFWQKHKGSPFPEVAESVQQELESYRAQEDEVKRLKSIMGLEGEDEGAISMLSDNTAKLTSAVSRDSGRQNEAVSYLLHKRTASTVRAGTPEDKMRLFLIYYISAQQAPSEVWKLTPEGAFAKMASTPASYGNTTTKPMGLLSRVMNTGSQFVMEGVKNLVLKQQNLPVTRILDNLMEMKSNPAIVFVVGGGNYIEYQNLVDYIKAKQGKHILYGCSEIFNATQFIKQLSQLGQK